MITNERTENINGKMTEKDVPAHADEECYVSAALLLARTYANMKTERENIRRWQEGKEQYTEDDALADLISVTPKAEDSLGIRVQTSGTSDQTARIGQLLASGYVQKQQAKIMNDLFNPAMQNYIRYLDWKIGIIEVACAERMTPFQAALFRQLFVRKKTYSELIQSFHGKRKLNKRKISCEKDRAVEAVANEVESENGRLTAQGDDIFIRRLMNEVREEERYGKSLK